MYVQSTDEYKKVLKGEKMKTIYYRDLARIKEEKTRGLSTEFNSFGYLQRIEESCFDNKIKYGINWSAWGTQDVETTERFICELQKAIFIAKELNEMFKDTEITYTR